MDIKKEVGERLKRSRKDAHYTQAQVAEMLLMTQQQYSRFENGIYELNYSQIIFYASCMTFRLIIYLIWKFFNTKRQFF